MAKLTAKQIYHYVHFGGVSCPYCGSYDCEEKLNLSTDVGECKMGVKCNHCGKEWKDVYKLETIEEEEE